MVFCTCRYRFISNPDVAVSLPTLLLTAEKANSAAPSCIPPNETPPPPSTLPVAELHPPLPLSGQLQHRKLKHVGSMATWSDTALVPQQTMETSWGTHNRDDADPCHSVPDPNRRHDWRVFPDQTQKPEVIPTIMVIRYLIMNTVKSGVMGAKLWTGQGTAYLLQVCMCQVRCQCSLKACS
ncbi:hypothetical protein EYF80_010348 [Liparis tanakae]|uniref:Uncharacterized protein n=1 Tax=Liparis tanakae TaxID=230148 RepID=A0A4Z2IN92_9TELE|nr:hypothetical protein EYF80_010348 [Liparis tanakae]